MSKKRKSDVNESQFTPVDLLVHSNLSLLGLINALIDLFRSGEHDQVLSVQPIALIDRADLVALLLVNVSDKSVEFGHGPLDCTEFYLKHSHIVGHLVVADFEEHDFHIQNEDPKILAPLDLCVYELPADVPVHAIRKGMCRINVFHYIDDEEQGVAAYYCFVENVYDALLELPNYQFEKALHDPK